MDHYVTASEARKDFSGTMSRVAYGRERLVLRRHSKEEVAIVPIEDLRLLERLEREAEDRQDAAEADRILKDSEEGERVSWEQLKKDLGL